MKAVVQDRYGPASEVLRLAEVEVPAPADDEVLVRVRAASVHPDVWHAVTHAFGQMALSPFLSRLPSPDLAPPRKEGAMAILAELLARGELTPVVDRAFPLAEAADALAYLAGGAGVGRVVVTPEGLAASRAPAWRSRTISGAGSPTSTRCKDRIL